MVWHPFLSAHRRHWQRIHDPFFLDLTQRVAELPSVPRAFMAGIVAGAGRTVSGLLGPEKGRLFKADVRLLGQREFFHLYYLASAGICAVFSHKNKFDDRRPFEDSLAEVFRLDPLRDEFYCVFTQQLNLPAQAFSLSPSLSYLLSELRRFAGEPEIEGPAADATAWAEEHYARPALFAELFLASVDFASALMAKNLQEWSKQQPPAQPLA